MNNCLFREGRIYVRPSAGGATWVLAEGRDTSLIGNGREGDPSMVKGLLLGEDNGFTRRSLIEICRTFDLCGGDFHLKDTGQLLRQVERAVESRRLRLLRFPEQTAGGRGPVVPAGGKGGPAAKERPAPAPAPGKSAAVPAARPPSPETAPRARPSAPSPLSPFDGNKTLGLFRAPDGRTVDLKSGWSGPAEGVPRGTPGFDIVTRTHVEGHAAALMRKDGLTEATVHINNPRICMSCEDLLPRMLPPGSRLTVVLPDGSSRLFRGA